MEQGTPTPLPVPGGVEGVTAGLGPDASWRWPEERWRQAVNKVRAGRPLRINGSCPTAVVAVETANQELLDLVDPSHCAKLLISGERLYLFFTPENKAAFAADPEQIAADAERKWPTVQLTLAP